jgi:RNA polymerase sigma-70 factor (ECF subfamily)
MRCGNPRSITRVQRSTDTKAQSGVWHRDGTSVALARCVDNSIDNHGLSVFLHSKPRLFSIAYRILRSAAEAEDVVQDVWIRWQTTDREVVRDARAFLATMAIRLALNVAQSARSRRETSVGPAPAESVDVRADPALAAERSQALKSAFHLLQRELSPTQRTAFVLREAFDYRYRDIADILRLEEANTRQLVTRARQSVAQAL